MKEQLSPRRRRCLAIALVIVLQTAVYVFAGTQKAYYHMDEAYSYGLANYSQVEIQANADFYNHWHSGEYYEDYLVVNEDERGDFVPVYENQKNDVHPPLFYLLLRLGMELTPGSFSKWTGIVLNILAFALSSVWLFLIVEKLFAGEQRQLLRTTVLTLAASITVAAISTVIYIRMYALLTMWVTLTLYLHILLVESKQFNLKLFIGISAVAMLGVLTQYYYLFLIVPLFVMTVIKYVRQRAWRELKYYAGGLAVAAVITLLLWPHSLQHLFFGDRGGGR